MNMKKERGQFFTKKSKVLNVLTSLVKNNGDIFEPSAGSGHIIKKIESLGMKNIYACELDEDKIKEKICNTDISLDNFFNFIKNDKKYDTIIGNPPFVKIKYVEDETIKLLPEKIKSNGNLYYYFIKYCVEVLSDKGELIFIVPKEWLYNTSSQFLRDYLSTKGNFTEFIDCGEEKLFDDANVPSLCIFRYELGYDGKVKYYDSIDNFNKGYHIEKHVLYNKTISFTNNTDSNTTIGDFFDVKVGLVSGKERVFKLDKLSSFTGDEVIKMITTKKIYENYIFLDDYNDINDIRQPIRDYILNHKEVLLSRRIRKFDETNFWKFGAVRNLNLMKSGRKRIYGLMKTRKNKPFFIGDTHSYFSGGVFGLFLKDGIILDLNDVVEYLNSSEFKRVMMENNLYTNNKLSITPSSFSTLPFGIP